MQYAKTRELSRRRATGHLATRKGGVCHACAATGRVRRRGRPRGALMAPCPIAAIPRRNPLGPRIHGRGAMADHGGQQRSVLALSPAPSSAPSSTPLSPARAQYRLPIKYTVYSGGAAHALLAPSCGRATSAVPRRSCRVVPRRPCRVGRAASCGVVPRRPWRVVPRQPCRSWKSIMNWPSARTSSSGTP